MAASGGRMGFLAVIMVSGGVALLVLGHHKLVDLNLNKPIQSNSSTLSCLSSGKSSPKKSKKKKKVRFSAELVESFGEKQEHHRQEAETCQQQSRGVDSSTSRHPVEETRVTERQPERNIPANRLALYNGMLRYRMNQASLYR